MKKTFAIAAFMGAFAASSHAALIFDSFDSYTAGTNLDGQAPPTLPNGNQSSTWTVTNGGIATGGFHAEAAPGSWDASTGSAYFGGWDPVTPGTVSMSANASITLADLTTTSIEIASFLPTGPGPNPTYSVIVGATSVGTLVTINLTPVSGGFNITASGAFAGPSGTVFIAEGVPTPLLLTTSASGVDVNFSLTNGINNLASGTFTGVSTSDSLTGLTIQHAAGGAGDGYLQIDNVSMIPEPSTALLGLMSAAFFFTRRRR
jgi:hypothetical protein